MNRRKLLVGGAALGCAALVPAGAAALAAADFSAQGLFTHMMLYEPQLSAVPVGKYVTFWYEPKSPMNGVFEVVEQFPDCVHMVRVDPRIIADYVWMRLTPDGRGIVAELSHPTIRGATDSLLANLNHA